MKKTLLISSVLVLAAVVAALWAFGKWNVAEVAAGEGGPELTLYTGENFTGRSFVVRATLHDLPRVEDPDGSFFDWNDQIRSIVVTGGTWRLYQHGRCNTQLDETELAELDVSSKDAREGWCSLVSATSSGPLAIANLAGGGIADDLSSIELVSTSLLPDWAQAMRQR